MSYRCCALPFLMLLLSMLIPDRAAAQELSRPQFVRLVQAYRLRQFQQPISTSVTGPAPALQIRAFAPPASAPGLSRRLHIELPGEMMLSLGGRLGSYGASSSIRLRIPVRLPVP